MSLDVWNTIELASEDHPRHIVVGDLHIWIKKRHDEIWIGHEYAFALNETVKNSDNPPDELSWSRWAPRNFYNELSVTPVFPDLPIVVSSEFPLKLSPGARIQIFTRIPIWVRLSIKKSGYLLTEIPSVRLSKTWFGTPVEGELCYWATTKARRSLSEVEKKPYVVNCPIWITNRAIADLDFEKFCFRVERLGIYQGTDELWAGETDIIYHGEEMHSDIKMTGRLHKGVTKDQPLSKPRKPISQSLATRTFRKIFDDTFISAR